MTVYFKIKEFGEKDSFYHASPDFENRVFKASEEDIQFWGLDHDYYDWVLVHAGYDIETGEWFPFYQVLIEVVSDDWVTIAQRVAV